MSKFRYTPDEQIKVHDEGAIRLLCSSFQSHEAGLPEWLKNSADAYARQDTAENGRLILVILNDGKKAGLPSISCLDFVGLTSKAIEENFRVWADPNAARGDTDSDAIQGGHGNGGKCYMVRMFEDHAQLHTVRNGKGNRYGIKSGKLVFGYIPNKTSGRDFRVSDIRKELADALEDTGCTLRTVENVARDVIKNARGFTLVTGVAPKDMGKNLHGGYVATNLQEHPQMIRTLELCHVYIVSNGRVYDAGEPLSLPEIDPLPGGEQARVIDIPKSISDPQSGEMISTTNHGQMAQGHLTLRTASVSMRWKLKGRHNITFRAGSGYIGYIPMRELDVQSSYRDRIYGECELQALEPLKQNDRTRLAFSPLSRAVEQFITEQVEKYAKEFEAIDRTKHNQEEKNELSRMNEALDEWKNHVLSELMEGLWGIGTDIGQPPPPPPLPKGKPARIEIALSHEKAGVGVAFRPTIKFFDKDLRRISAVPYRWVSDDNNVALVDEELLIINTFRHGSTEIHAETLDGRVKSNRVPLEVVRIRRIRIQPEETEVPAGSRKSLEAICTLADGTETSGVYLLWTESNNSIARVSASGIVYGFAPGETEVTTGDDKCEADKPVRVKVTPQGARGPGDRHGKGLPRILVSEVDKDPETNEDVSFPPEDPPVWQRAQDVDRNIWWINSAAPMARLYLDRDQGYGYNSREWRIYHVERIIEIMGQITLTHGPEADKPIGINEWLTTWGGQIAQIQAMAASDLNAFIKEGELPVR
jgi:hypothetical protein